MFSHMMVGSNDLPRAKAFYDATLGALGIAPGQIDARGRLVYPTPTGVFMVTRPIDGKPASTGNGSTVGFSCPSPEQADAWHKAGIANGGVAIEDPPGERESGSLKFYLAYLRDPDGNKLCVLHRMT